MITLIVSLVAATYISGFVWMLVSMKRSPEGYEDELGFHQGCERAVVVDATQQFAAQDRKAA